VGLEREVRDVERRAGRLAGDRPAFDAISDEALLTHLEELIDLLVHGWDIGCVNTFLVGGPITMITHRYGQQAALNVRAGTGTLRSAGLLTGVRELAEMVDADTDLRRLITDPSGDVVLAKLRDEFPVFAERFDRLLAEYGHRGPGETELSNQVYADAPELVFRAVTGSLGGKDRANVPAQHSPLGRALERVAVKGIERRERARDANMRIFFEVRLAVREWGTRLAVRGSLASPEDVHYLSIDEIYYPPADSRERVTRRRSERERLKKLDYPLHFRQPWVPQDPADAYAADQAITGTPVSSGTARGRVRIMVDAGDDLEPGEVLVANATDTGWTPFFGCAAAVVTNVGGVMSHAAIVAREFGIPAVVNTVDATRRLRNGQLVEVDGTAGTVSIIEESLDDHTNGVS
jgi:phosphohistidine swiveling domain-containing protein